MEVQQQCGLFWFVRWPEACVMILSGVKQALASLNLRFVGTTRTATQASFALSCLLVFACFGSRLTSVLLLAHKLAQSLRFATQA